MAPRRIRIAAAQIDYQPAYLGRSFSYLREPAIIEETENGLSALEQFFGIPELRTRISATWVDHIRQRLEPILYFCAVHQVDVLVFPEYSIPVDVLPELQGSANTRKMVIVAGSHTVVGDQVSRKVYEQTGLARLNLRPADPDSDIRKSVCPIFIPDSKAEIIEKRSKSVWETDMTSGRAASTLSLNIRGTTYKTAILLCIDALQLDQLAALYMGDSRPELLIVPSLSRTTTPFDNVFQLSMMNEIPSVYVNGAEWGGSKVFARPGTASPTWPMHSDGCEQLPKGTEAIVIAEIDFDEQMEARKTVRPHLGLKVIAYAPLLYVSLSDLCSNFVALRKRCFDPRASSLPDDVRQQLSMLSKTEPTLFPHLLQKKLRLLVDSAKSGSLRFEDTRLLLGTVDVPAEVCPTFVLRQFLIQAALEKVAGLIGARDSIREEERVFKVLRNVSKQRTELPSTIRCAPPNELMQPSASRSSEERTKQGNRPAKLFRSLTGNKISP